MRKYLLILFTLLIVTTMVSAQWTEQVSGVTTQLTSVSAIDDNNAWICGYSARVLKTTNGGSTWTAVTNPSTNDNYNIWGVDINTALVTYSPTGATFVKRTTDGGTTWTQVFTETGAAPFIDAIWFTSATNGFMYGDPVGGRWSLWRTTNGGVNWDSTGLYVPQNGSEAGWNNGIYMNGTQIWFVTNVARIYYSGNGGTSFAAQTITAAGATGGFVWFNSSTTGMCGANGVMDYTTNTGTTWTAIAPPGTANIVGITGVGSIWYFIRQANIIYKSTNNGTAWTTGYTGPTGAIYNNISKSRGGARMWAVTSIGGISKSDELIGVTPISYEIPKQYSLNQNYPNPFNPTTTITFSLPRSSNVSIKIYDIIGNEVMTVLNEYKTAGSYSANIDASKLSSGVYFYTLRTNDFKDTKKMILSK